jgi:flagellar FliL protein
MFAVLGNAMTDVTAEVEEEAPKKKSPLILSLILALVGAGGGFFAVSSGLILGGDPEGGEAKEKAAVVKDLPDIAFVPLDPITIAIQRGQTLQHLRFRAEIEVEKQYQEDVAGITPRIADVMNSYLRAIDPEELSDPLALVKLRAQMLRRIQVVTGRGRVRDLLILDFVLN